MATIWEKFHSQHWRGSHETTDEKFYEFRAAVNAGKVKLDFHSLKDWVYENVPISRKGLLNRFTYNKTLIGLMAADRKLFDTLWRMGIDIDY